MDLEWSVTSVMAQAEMFLTTGDLATSVVAPAEMFLTTDDLETEWCRFEARAARREDLVPFCDQLWPRFFSRL